MSIQDWEWMFTDNADAEQIADAERELAERRDAPPVEEMAVFWEPEEDFYRRGAENNGRTMI